MFSKMGLAFEEVVQKKPLKNGVSLLYRSTGASRILKKTQLAGKVSVYSSTHLIAVKKVISPHHGR